MSWTSTCGRSRSSARRRGTRGASVSDSRRSATRWPCLDCATMATMDAPLQRTSVKPCAMLLIAPRSSWPMNGVLSPSSTPTNTWPRAPSRRACRRRFKTTSGSSGSATRTCQTHLDVCRGLLTLLNVRARVDRNIDQESCAGPRRAVDRDAAAMALGHALDERQAQSPARGE